MEFTRLPTIALCILALSHSLHGADFHVDPAGSDADSGTASKPLASLEAARDKARSLAGKEAVTVHVADGVYYLPETLVFTPADSGSEKYPVVYRAENESGAVLSGGSKLDLKWAPYRDGIYQAPTPVGLEIDQLFIDGRNQRMARYPNYDASKKSEAYQGFAADAFSKERVAGWADPTGGYIHAMHVARWGGYHYRITGKDGKGEVTYEGGWQNNRQMGMHKDYRMVENIFEELDASGEWYHNSKTNTLYYKPQPGADLEAATVEVVRLRHLVEFEGSMEDPVRHITFEGFVVRHAARTFMDTKEQMLRSDWAIYRGGAFMLTGTEDVSILDCEFDQVGGNGIFVNTYNRRTLVKGCHIHDAGASGVCFVGDPDAVRDPLFEYGEKNDLSKIDRTPGPKTENYPALGVVEDCLIHGIGRTERQPAGVMMEMAMEITVRDCSIYDCARSGINIGDGAWGGHLIERVDVFDTVLETHDHGSFNSWGRDRYWRSDVKPTQKAVNADPKLPFLDAIKTTTIRDSRWRCDHGWDIDLDDGSSNYDLYNNLMLQSGLKLREGFRRHAWNNVAPFGNLHPHVWYDGSKDQVYANIFAKGHRPARMSKPYVDGTMVDRNFFINSHERIIESSKKLGWDQNSIGGDPMFIDPANGDFRVKEGSPALDVGFKNFPMDQFGVKKPSLKAIARTPIIPAVNVAIGGEGKGPGAVAPMDSYWLGAKLHELRGEEFSAYGVTKEDGGAALIEVSKSSEAHRLGFRENDLIQGLNEQKVSSLSQLFGALAKVGSAPLKVAIVRNQKNEILPISGNSHVIVEAADSADGFSKCSLPTPAIWQVSTNQATSDEAIGTLTDGSLARNYGAIFANGIQNGAYRIDLGESKPVAALTGWSFKKGRRGVQKVTLYGSNSATDPGWNLGDRSRFQPLGSIDTSGWKSKAFTAASLRASEGRSLGIFRWIVWSVSPVTPNGGGENTAFQEFSVELGANKAGAALPYAPANTESISVNAFPGEKTDFKGYDRYKVKTAKGMVSVVCPKNAAPGKPWMWRSIFWGGKSGAVKRVTIGDLRLIENGYHVVIAPGDVSGHPRGNAAIDAAYETLTKDYGFSKTLSMASMSRETLALFRWASSNPEKVESLYVDNGVCNVKSWPGGTLVRGSGSEGSGDSRSWELLKKTYGFASDEEALAAIVSPIDLLEPLAKAGVPILMVCGTKDVTVPYEENGAIMKERYEKLGGSIQLILEPKGHHPHGLADQTPIVEFIENNTR